MSKRPRPDDGGRESVSTDDADTTAVADHDYAQSPAKWLHVDDESDNDNANKSTAGNYPGKAYIECILPPHRSPWHFDSYESYERHIDAFHSNRCYECNCNLPSQHYLNLHLSEHHDPFDAIRRDKGEKTFACLVEGCDRLCSSPPKRRMHCIDKHNFPKTYNFAVIDYGIDPRDSGQLHRAFLADRQARRQAFRKQKAQERGDPESSDRKSSVDHGHGIDTSMSQSNGAKKSTNDMPIEEVTSSLGALNFQPRSLKFGRKNNAGFARPA